MIPGDSSPSVDVLNALLIELFRSEPVGKISPAKLGRFIREFQAAGIDLREFYQYTRAKEGRKS